MAKVRLKSTAPPCQFPNGISYETAASLVHIMSAAYVGLEEHNPKLYAEVMVQTKRFFEHLDAYVSQHS